MQGDVGSGKTIVAAEAAVIAIENGYQVAVLAPTEILATQHGLYFKQILSKLGYVTLLLTGSFTAREKAQLKKLIAEGLAHVVIGTHALLEKVLDDLRDTKQGGPGDPGDLVPARQQDNSATDHQPALQLDGPAHVPGIPLAPDSSISVRIASSSRPNSSISAPVRCTSCLMSVIAMRSS